MGDEFINGLKRYCLWLVDCPPSLLRSMPKVIERVDAVRRMRSSSSDKQTQKAALRPTMFQAIRQDLDTSYLAIPRVSSERRKYIPMAFLNETIWPALPTNRCRTGRFSHGASGSPGDQKFNLC